MIELIFGKESISFYLAWFLFSGMGFFLHKAYSFIRKRKIKGEFNLAYFWLDNKGGLLVGFIYSFCVARFELYSYLMVSEVTISMDKMFIGFIFGLYYTVLASALRRLKILR